MLCLSNSTLNSKFTQINVRVNSINQISTNLQSDVKSFFWRVDDFCWITIIKCLFVHQERFTVWCSFHSKNRSAFLLFTCCERTILSMQFSSRHFWLCADWQTQLIIYKQIVALQLPLATAFESCTLKGPEFQDFFFWAVELPCKANMADFGMFSVLNLAREKVPMIVLYIFCLLAD